MRDFALRFRSAGSYRVSEELPPAVAAHAIVMLVALLEYYNRTMTIVPRHRVAACLSSHRWPGRVLVPVALVLFVSLFAGGLVVFAAGINDAAARKLSDAFMSDLIANKVSDAVTLLAPE